MKRFTWMLPVVAVFLLGGDCGGGSEPVITPPPNGGLSVDPDVRAQLPDGAIVRATGTKEIGGETFQRVKFELPDGEMGGMAFDSGNQRVTALPTPTRPMIDPRLQALLDQSDPDAQIDIVVVLDDPPLEVVEEPGSAQVTITEDGDSVGVLINGDEATLQALETLEAQRDQRRLDLLSGEREAERDTVRRFLESTDWPMDRSAEESLEMGGTLVRRQLSVSEINDLVNRIESERSATQVVGIEPYEERYDELTSAMASTNVQVWAINQGHRGANIGIYMSEAGDNCPVSPHINTARFTQLSGAGPDSHSNFVGNILTRVAPDAHVFCGNQEMISNPASQSPRVYVTNQSWGAGSDTTYVGRDRDFDNAVYNHSLAVFKSAGNRGNLEGNVTTPGKAFNIIAVGNYQDSNNTMAGTSSFVDPETNAEKPDLSAPGSSITTTAGTGGGTSFAAPHAAAFAADLLGRYSWLRLQPARVKALMMAGASRNIEGSARLSERDGAGGINYLNSGYNGTNTVWWGPNGSHFDATAHVSTTRTLTAGQRYRIALSWITSGSYAYSNKNVNMDLDLKIYRPGGGWVTGSYSWDNGFEIVDFTAPVSGTYTIKVHRYWNSGNGKVNMAVHSQRIL